MTASSLPRLWTTTLPACAAERGRRQQTSIDSHYSDSSVWTKTAATDEEMERFYQDLSQAVKQVPKGNMLLVMGDFNAKVCRTEPSAMSSAVGLYGETNEASEQLEDFCLEQELALTKTTSKQHPRRLYTCISPDGNTRNHPHAAAAVNRWDRQTYGRTSTQLLHRPCSANYAGSVDET